MAIVGIFDENNKIIKVKTFYNMSEARREMLANLTLYSKLNAIEKRVDTSYIKLKNGKVIKILYPPYMGYMTDDAEIVSILRHEQLTEKYRG